MNHTSTEQTGEKINHKLAKNMEPSDSARVMDKIRSLDADLSATRISNLFNFGRHMEAIAYDEDGQMVIRDVTEEVLGLKPMTNDSGWMKFEDSTH